MVREIVSGDLRFQRRITNIIIVDLNMSPRRLRYDNNALGLPRVVALGTAAAKQCKGDQDQCWCFHGLGPNQF